MTRRIVATLGAALAVALAFAPAAKAATLVGSGIKPDLDFFETDSSASSTATSGEEQATVPPGPVQMRVHPDIDANAVLGATRGAIKVSTATSPVTYIVRCPDGFTFPTETVFPGEIFGYLCNSGGVNPLVGVTTSSLSYPALFGEWVEFLSGGAALRNRSGSFFAAQSGRFRVFVSWYLNNNLWGTGSLVPFGTNVSGFFSYDLFDPNDFQLITKVINACGVNGNGRYWVFAGGATDLYVTVAAWDLATNLVRTYSSPLGAAFQAVNDIQAFATCP